MKRKGFSIAAAALFALLLASTGFAQSLQVGTIEGHVLDQSGAIVPGATVSLINEGTKFARTATTDGKGQFYFAAVEPGSYTLKAELSGFKSYEAKGQRVGANATAGVDIVINGQQHNYERFKPMTPGGDVDTARGIREFNVGTGGSSVEDFTVSVHPNSETRAAVYGVLQLTLKATGYDWKFLPILGSNYSDSGSGTCH